MIFKRAVARLRAQDWVALSIELAIVTVGVIIALAAQQMAEERSWQAKVEASKSALRHELAEHYSYAVEFRVVYPCLQAQLNRLRNRVLSSGATLDPAPIYKELRDDYVLRMPTKFYPADVWEEALNGGIVQRFEPTNRRVLAGYYAALTTHQELNSANNQGEQALMGVAHPMPIDASVRFSIIGQIEQMSGRFQYLDLMNGQLIDYLKQMKMVPPAGEARAVTQRYGTYRFCRAQGLPMRSFKNAMQAIPN